jgi:hypothetical protein
LNLLYRVCYSWFLEARNPIGVLPADFLKIKKENIVSTVKNFTSLVKLWIAKILANFALRFIQERIKELPLGWDLRVMAKCTNAHSVEIHGKVNGLFRKNFIQGKLKCIEFRNSELFLILDNSEEEYCIKQVGQPHFIDEDGWDCLWCGFSTGHVVFYFKPKSKIKTEGF